MNANLINVAAFNDVQAGNLQDVLGVIYGKAQYAADTVGAVGGTAQWAADTAGALSGTVQYAADLAGFLDYHVRQIASLVGYAMPTALAARSASAEVVEPQHPGERPELVLTEQPAPLDLAQPE